MLYTDLELPDDVRDALVADIEHLPLLAFSILLQREPEFAPGFRPDPKNLAAFRKRLVEKFLNPSVALTKKEVEAIRHHGFNMKAVCVLSHKALTFGFPALSGFFGGAKLVAGMLVDEREDVRDAAREVLATGKQLPPPPADPDAAREELRRQFTPFIDLLSSSLLAPVKKVVAPQNTRDAELRRDVERAEKNLERLKAEFQKAKEANAALQGELEEARSRALEERTAKSEAESAVRATTEKIRELERTLSRVEPRATSAEGARAEAERRAKEAQKRATAAEEALRGALARLEAAEARVAALEAEKAKSAENAAKAEFDKFLVETMPVRIDEFGPAEILSRTFGRRYRKDDPVMFLVDGHNILNLNYPELSKERTNNLPHNEVRYMFVGKCRVLSLGFPNSMTRVFFDGNDARQKVVSRNLMVEYSGNPNRVEEHRADMAIVNHVAFLAYRDDIDLESVFVVSSDQELCENARAFGVHTISHTLFADIMAACK